MGFILVLQTQVNNEVIDLQRLMVGVLKTIQIALQAAHQEFESALQDSELVEISNSQKIEDIEPTPMIVVVRDTRIRSLRKEASQQGIRNVSRMTKAELLTALQYSS